MGTYIKNSCGGNCSPTLTCCVPSFKVKRKSATLNLVGFSPFTCPNTPVPAPNTPITRYLEYKVDCSSAQFSPGDPMYRGYVGCGTAIYKSASTTYTIDPFTGLQCVSGDVSVGCGCDNGSNNSFTCSPTSQTTDCDPASLPPEYAGCTTSNTISLSLGQPYTITNVVTKVDAMMSANSLDNVAKFPAWNSDAQILAGTGGSTAVSWQPVSPCSVLSTLYYKSDYSVTKSELKLEFLETAKLKTYFTPQAGGAKTLESEVTYNKNQSVTISAPTTPGVRTLEVISATAPSSPTFASSITPVTTGQRVILIPNSGFEVRGPGCKAYDAVTTVNSYSYSSSSSGSSAYYPNGRGSPIGEGGSGTSSRRDNYTVTITRSIDGTTSVSSGTGSFSDDFQGINIWSSTENTSRTLAADGTLTTVRSGTSTDYNGQNPYSYGPDTTEAPYEVPMNLALCNRTTTNTTTDTPYEWGPLVTTTTTTTEQRSISGSSSTSSVQITRSTSYTLNNDYQDYNGSSTESITWTSTSTYTDPPLTPANSTPETYDSNGGLCSWKNRSGTGRWEDSQSLTANFNVSVTVPTVAEPATPTNYKTFVHWFVVTDDSSNPNCPTRSVRAENRTKFNYVRGPFSVTESATLPTDLNVTHCITNMAASTEVQL